MVYFKSFNPLMKTKSFKLYVSIGNPVNNEVAAIRQSGTARTLCPETYSFISCIAISEISWFIGMP